MAEIIVPIALSAVTAGGGVALGTITVGQALFAVGAAAVTAGANALLADNSAATAQAAAAPANSQRSILIAQAVPPRRMAFGPLKTGGALFFQDNDNPKLYVGSILSDGVVEALDATYFGEELVPVDENGDAVSGSRYATYFSRNFAAGELDQEADADLIAAFPNQLGETFRQCGVARVVAVLDWGTDAAQHTALWGDTISPAYLIKGVKVFDPRDENQDVDDASTWAYSANPALCVAHALTHAWGVAISADDIDYTALAAAADVCDETVTVGDSELPMFRCGGVFQGDTDLASQIQDMLSAFRGHITFNGGKYAIVADDARSSVWTVTDDDILEIHEWTAATETRHMYNAVSAAYYDVGLGGARTTTAPYEMTEAATEGLRETSVSLPFTPDNHSAQINAYRNLIEARDGRSIVMRLTDAALYLLPTEVITIDSDDAAFLNGDYQIVQIDLADVGAIVTLRGYDSDVYADPSTYLV